MRRTAVVVGGGISGLAAALELLAQGVAPEDVTVLEAGPRTGGLLRAGEVGGVRVDLGAEAMLARRDEGVALAHDVGLAGSLVEPTAARPAVWRRSGARPLPGGTVMGVPGSATDLSVLLEPDEVRATHDAMTAAARRGPAPDADEDVDVARAVVADVGRPVLDLLVEPLLGGVYAGRTEQLSLAATVPALARARRDGEPMASAVDRAGAAATPGVPVFTGVADGMARLADEATARLREAGVRIHHGARATGLERVGGGWRVRAEGADGERRHDADLVVLALPTTTTARLLAEPVPEAGAALAEVPVASVAVVALAVPGWPPGDQDLRSGLLVPPVESAAAGLDVKAVTFSSSKWGWVAEQDPDVTVLRASVGRVGETAALRRDDAALVDLVRRDLAVLLSDRPPAAAAGGGPPGLVDRLRSADAVVARWGGALPQYLPGHAQRLDRLHAAVDRAGGLAVTGGFVDGVGVPACIATARRAVQRLLAA